MSQTDITNSNQYQQAAVKTRPPHSSAAECDFLSVPRLRRTCPYVTVCLSVRIQPQQIPPPREVFFFSSHFSSRPQLPAANQCWVVATASNFLGAHVGARVGVCVFPLRLLQVST